MTLKIVKAADPVHVERINVCLYSGPGIGKSSLAFTSDAPLMLDFDHGSHRACNRKDVVIVEKWAEVLSFTADELAPYKTLIVDTAGRALDALTTDIIADNPKMGRGGALTLQGFGALKSRFAAWLKMVNTFGKDVVLIAHMDEQRSGDDVVERLDVQGGSKAEIYKSVDAMGRIFIKGKEREIDFSPRENAFGKNPCNLEIIPFQHPDKAPNLLGQLMQLMKDKMNHMSDQQKGAQTDLEEWTEYIDGFTTAEEFNQAMAELKTSSVPVKAMAAKKAKKLGFTFDPVSKLYLEKVNA
jgi:hypothetical protein